MVQATSFPIVSQKRTVKFDGESFQLAFNLYGNKRKPTFVVLGGISANRFLVDEKSRDIKGWWREFFQDEPLIDLNEFSILTFDFLGGNGESSGPKNEIKKNFSIHDQARALSLLLEDLGIKKLEGLIGSSYGGMVGLSFAIHFSEKLKQLVLISASHYSNARSIGWRSVQREVVKLARANGRTKEGLKLARALAMLGYRSTDELDSRFGNEKKSVDDHFEIENYIYSQGTKFSSSFHPDAFINLGESIDHFSVDPKEVKVPLLAIGVDSDQLVFPHQIKELVEQSVKPSRYVEISSKYGHDAFLKESHLIGPIIKNHIQRIRL